MSCTSLTSDHGKDALAGGIQFRCQNFGTEFFINGTEFFINGTESFINGTESFMNGTESFMNFGAKKIVKNSVPNQKLMNIRQL